MGTPDKDALRGEVAAVDDPTPAPALSAARQQLLQRPGVQGIGEGDGVIVVYVDADCVPVPATLDGQPTARQVVGQVSSQDEASGPEE